MVGSNGVLIDQGTQALRVGTADVSVITAGLERLRVSNDGNVGIGVTNPSTLFHVNGGASSFMDGNVGIGVTNPSSALQVVGESNFGGNITSSTGSLVNFGNALKTVNSDLGFTAASFATTALPTGVQGGVISNTYRLTALTSQASMAMNISGFTYIAGATYKYTFTTMGGSVPLSMTVLQGTSTGVISNNPVTNSITTSDLPITGYFTTANTGGNLAFNFQAASANPIVNWSGFTLTRVDTEVQTNLIVDGKVGVGTTNPVGKLHVNSGTAIGTLGSTFILGNPLGPNANRPAISALDSNTTIWAYDSTGTYLDNGFMRLAAGGGTDKNNKAYIDLSGYSTIPDMNLNIAFGTLGQERMRINRDGNVGIGVTNPGVKLDVNGVIRTHNDVYINKTVPGTSYISNNADYFIPNGNPIVTLRMQSGSYTRGSNFNIHAAIDFMNVNTNADFPAGIRGGEIVFNTMNGASGFSDVPLVERMRITANGNVGIGATNPTIPLAVSGAGYYSISGGWINNGGVASNSTYTGFGVSIASTHGMWAQSFGFITSSDHRIKKDIKHVSNTLDKISQIEVVSYNHIDEKSGSPVGYGVVAQQVAPIVPTAVHYQQNKIPCVYAYGQHDEISPDRVRVFADFSSAEVKEGLKLVVTIQEKEHKLNLHTISRNYVECDKWENYSANDKVFVYGVEVNDFMCVDKEQLGLMSLAGVKELAQENQQLKQQVSDLTSRLSRVESLLAQLIR